MSIYSGFGTRKQEHEYNTSIERLINLLSQKILELHLNQGIDDQKFVVSFGKIYGAITKLEQNKYLPPKFSESANELAKKLGFYYEQISNAIGSNYSTIQMNERIVKNSSLLNSSKQTLSVQKNMNQQKASPQLAMSQSPRLPTKNKSKSGISSPKILNRLDEGYKTDKQESTGDELNQTFPIKQKNRNSFDNTNKKQVLNNDKKQSNINQNNHGSQNNIVSVSQVIQNQQIQMARQNSSNNNKSSVIPSVVLQPIPLQQLDQNKKNNNELLIQVNLLEESNKFVNLYPSSDQDSQQNYELNDHKLKQQNDQFLDKWSKLCSNIYKYQTGEQPQIKNESTQELNEEQIANGNGLDPIAQEALNFQIIQKQRQQYYQQQMIKNQQFIQSQILNQKLFNQQMQQNLQGNQDNLAVSRVSRKNAVSQSLQRYQKQSPQAKNNRSTSITNPTTVKVNNRYNLDNSKLLSQKKENYKKLNQNGQNVPQFTNFSNNSTSNKNSSSNLRVLPDLNTSQNLGSLNQNNIQIQQSYQFHNESNFPEPKKQLNNVSEDLPQSYQNRYKQQAISGKESNQDNLNTQINATKKQQMIFQNREPINYRNQKTEGTEQIQQNISLPQTNQSYSFSNSKNIVVNGGKKQKSPYNSILGYPIQQKNKARRLSNIQLENDQEDPFSLDQSIQRIYKESKAYSTQHKENKQMANFNLSQSTKNQNKEDIQIPQLQPQIQPKNESGFFITPTQ
ncbi:hypothetical protein TTHERM_00971670 (macronuclear) [Tetrahymena thermophila SB210]|uniref:Uncharacterized protein n=1 Tax=Tetrahymena thermophila (strain SB210) TaxID=312017 RepID=Q24DK5_TETTS|nr:hypothetical protein TTHERM_00971670 [Tetrahymena thermophila SB210]EAS05843.2 hypothetical protein TTHERM_00971670 [Tetrahymena thermophila SB210]|eukprot:XP_001026088.2 hypothetical protein TTHERM_00971670 [Tetrahymena thermophila SB210]